MRIKIESDGTTVGTKVTNAETGEIVEGVVAASWFIRSEDMVAMAILEIQPLEIVARADTKVVRRAGP